jgi:uncharacterized membrane protein
LVEYNIYKENPPDCKFANSDHYTGRKPPVFLSWLSGIISFCFLFYPYALIDHKFRYLDSMNFVGMSVFLIVLFLSSRIGLTVYTGKMGCRIPKKGNVDFIFCVAGIFIFGLLSILIAELSSGYFSNYEWVLQMVNCVSILIVYYFLKKFRDRKF